MLCKPWWMMIWVKPCSLQNLLQCVLHAALMMVCNQYGHIKMLALPLALTCFAVHQDRIGASNFFWSFPSEAAVKVQIAFFISDVLTYAMMPAHCK